ncbi:pectinesterase family protein [Kineococcus rhizosphaerae]|uniref:Pectinesterase n=1 Tax=Kineococcus rhizosphaerae TaxID=559628 RepID=A0A2T0QXE3_9ACTN|nr:pectinesterase family protein [Kineococcus rhizosphaerae]PRY10546.1 pectinesterase [Kineococcus rhizosphaerae]
MNSTVVVGDDAELVPSIGLALADPDVTEIVVRPGRYVEHLRVEPRGLPLTIRSSTGRAEDVVISFGLRQGDRDRTGLPYVQDCATLTVAADDVRLLDLTVENTYDKRVDPDLPDSQAIAIRTLGDRIRLERCRLIGRQDTLLLDAPGWSDVRHVHLTDCYVEGDVDFVYGRATAVIEGGEVRSNGPGWVAAPSTARENPRGLLFSGVRLTGPGLPAGSVHLGRPWHPGGKPDAVGQAFFVDCAFGPHVAAEGFTEMGGFDWRDARFGVRGGTGPVNPDWPAVPEGSPVEPAQFLAGWDGPAKPTGRIVVVSDSTASAYPGDRFPRTGWGQVLAEVSGAEVLDLAVSGASSGSFLATGAFDAALDRLEPGDLLLVAFGHNDAKPDERFADVHRTYPANLRRMVVGARSRGAHPVLLTPVERRSFDDRGRARSTHGGYPEAVRRLAVADGIAWFDLTVASRRLWQEQGEEGSKDSFLWLAPGVHAGFPDGERDDTHLSRAGAVAVAELVTSGLRDLGLLS